MLDPKTRHNNARFTSLLNHKVNKNVCRSIITTNLHVQQTCALGHATHINIHGVHLVSPITVTYLIVYQASSFVDVKSVCVLVAPLGESDTRKQ